MKLRVGKRRVNGPAIVNRCRKWLTRLRLWLIISHKYLSPIVESIEAVKTAISRGVDLVAEAKVPLTNGMGHIARLLEVLWHQGHIDGDTGGHQRLDVHVLTTHPVRVLAGHHGDPAGGAGGLHVVLVQQDPGGG